MLQKILISNKCCSFKLSINQKILKKKVFIKNIRQQLFSAFLEDQIRMISEGSCDTKHWSNGCH